MVAEPWACLFCKKSVNDREDAMICLFSSKFKKSKLLLLCGVTIATAVGGLDVCNGNDTEVSLFSDGDFSVLGDIFCEC